MKSLRERGGKEGCGGDDGTVLIYDNTAKVYGRRQRRSVELCDIRDKFVAGNYCCLVISVCASEQLTQAREGGEFRHAGIRRIIRPPTCLSDV